MKQLNKSNSTARPNCHHTEKSSSRGSQPNKLSLSTPDTNTPGKALQPRPAARPAAHVPPWRSTHGPVTFSRAALTLLVVTLLASGSPSMLLRRRPVGLQRHRRRSVAARGSRRTGSVFYKGSAKQLNGDRGANHRERNIYLRERGAIRLPRKSLQTFTLSANSAEGSEGWGAT